MPAAAAKAPPRDHVRETLETLVFVVVLVLILQLFVLEAFVIPTGSMAETQLGYHKNVVCQQCSYGFPVNCSDEVERPSRDTYVYGYKCPNCQNVGMVDWNGVVSPTSGDRVLVHKAMSADVRGRVVVFKYPVAPQKKQQAQNYIKRCVGFGEETVALAYGDQYVTKALKYADRTRPDDPRDEWQEAFTFPRDPAALALFAEGKAKGFPAGVEKGFELFRKPNELAMEMRRVVYDNDFQATDLLGKVPPRWATRPGEGAGWAAEDAKPAKTFTHQGDAIGWIGYRHLVKARDGENTPQKITNGMGYNGGLGYGDSDQPARLRPLKSDVGGSENLWVGDLMLECAAKLEAGSQLTLELSKGEHRYQATFADGQVTLVRTGPGNWPPVARPTAITKPGTYQLRFANVDCRLRVWVNDAAIDFGAEADYPPTADGKEDHPNNLEAPAGIAAKGTVAVSGLKLWRDTHYTPDFFRSGTTRDTVETYYVHPGHYLCLGDNSAQSSDGRTWGVVPERLMIGRAVFTFFPIHRIGVIR